MMHISVPASETPDEISALLNVGSVTVPHRYADDGFVEDPANNSAGRDTGRKRETRHRKTVAPTVCFTWLLWQGGL